MAPAPQAPVPEAFAPRAAPPQAVAPASPKATASCHHDAPAACVQPAPSFADEVEPILKKRCFACHTGNGVAADEHDFSTMKSVVAERGDIVDEISSCSMPPRSPLGDDEAGTLLRWASCAQTVR